LKDTLITDTPMGRMGFGTQLYICVPHGMNQNKIH